MARTPILQPCFFPGRHARRSTFVKMQALKPLGGLPYGAACLAGRLAHRLWAEVHVVLAALWVIIALCVRVVDGVVNAVLALRDCAAVGGKEACVGV